MIPVIALVGRPNVGKSTLFNRLTRTKDALVADFPGLTRDRQYGDAQFKDKPFIVVDTGGIGVDDLDIDTLMSKQSRLAIDEADVIFFMVDGRSGRTGVDQSVAVRLRKTGKKVYVIVNKVDGVNEDDALAEFQAFGFPISYAISASHGRGLPVLLADVTKNFPSLEEAADTANGTKITFVGRPNVGKSTLINRILGEERVVVYDLPGTTRDSISIPFERDEKKYQLIDTAGIRRRSRVDEKIEKFSIIKTLQSIKDSHVCMMLIDAKEGITEQDLHLLGYIIEAGKALVIAVNKWDGLAQDHREQVREKISRRLQFLKFAKIRFISALHGSGVGNLFADINQAYASATQRFSTPQLTRLLEDFVSNHSPPLVRGRRVKLRYAHSGGHNPPIIVVHGNQVDALPDAYKRYLMNGYIEQLNLIGTPLKLEFKSGENPFKNKKNTLTARQITKKKRLIRHIKKRK